MVILKTKKTQEKGFSILEFAVVIAIVGVLAAGTLSIYSEQQTHAEWQQSDQKVALVKKSLVHFAKSNRYLPCPSSSFNGLESRVAATGTTAAVTASPVVPAIPATTTAPLIPAIPETTAQVSQTVSVEICEVSEGFVPYELLGLSRVQAEDSWGNPIVYAVNPGVTSANRMVDCPNDSVCFYSNRQIPSYDMTTPPVIANPGVDNLRVCNGDVTSCLSTTPSSDHVSDNALAVLVALNENGGSNPVSNTAEADNADGDRFFIQSDYSESPYFDDLIGIITASEIREADQSEIVVTSTTGGIPPTSANPNNTGVLQIAGGTGDNDRFSENIGINIESQTISMGSENAGKQVTLTFDAKIEGGWEDAGVNGGTPQTSGGRLETQDRFLVGINGPDVSDLDDTLANLNDSVARFDSHQETESFYYDENLDSDNTWYEKVTIDTILDSNGDLNIDFAVFSTHVTEKVEVSNVEATIYETPPPMPPMPLVSVGVDEDYSGTIDSGETHNYGGY